MTVRSAQAGDEPGIESTKRGYRIPAGPLGPALSRFAAASGARLSFNAALTEGKTSRGLSGDFTREEGLAALLAGTGLEWAPGPGGTYTVRPTSRAQATPEAPVPTGEQPALLDTITLDPITVTAQPLDQGFKADTQETATKTPLSIRETPQSISVITQESLKARQVIGLGQALETVAGVTQSHEPGPFGGRSPIGFSQQKIRGIQGEFFFDVREDGFLNPHIFASTDLAPYERVEVIKGPSSTLYGRGAAGGFINQVRKKPLPEFQAEVATSIGSYDLYRLDADVTGPLAGTDWARGRLVATYESAGAYVDFVDSERVVVAPSLELDVTDSTRLLLQGTYQSDHGLANLGFPLLNDGENFKAPDVRRSLLFGLPHVDKDDNPRELTSGSLQLDQKLGDLWLATPLPGWNISFGGLLLDSEFIDRRDPNFGNAPRDVADWQIGLYTSYELRSGPLKGLGFGTGLFAIDDRSVVESSPGKLEGYERVDLQTFYNGFKSLNISLLVRNVFDAKYVETQTFSSFGNTFGSPTAVLLTVRYDFGN